MHFNYFPKYGYKNATVLGYDIEIYEFMKIKFL